MKLHFISLTKKQLDAVPDGERTLLILCAHAANELNILIKLFRFCSEHPAATDAEERARNAQAMTMGRLLTGKLYECWKLMRSAFFGAQLSRTYEQLLDPEAKTALGELKRYFSGPNLIEAVRNRHAFHYAPDQISRGYVALSEHEPLPMYMSDANANTLYAFADVIAGYSMIEDIQPGDPKNAYGALISETSKVLGQFNQLIAGCMVVVMQKYVGADLEALGSKEVEVSGAPDWKSVTVPYFVEIAESEVT